MVGLEQLINKDTNNLYEYNKNFFILDEPPKIQKKESIITPKELDRLLDSCYQFQNSLKPSGDFGRVDKALNESVSRIREHLATQGVDISKDDLLLAMQRGFEERGEEFTNSMMGLLRETIKLRGNKDIGKHVRDMQGHTVFDDPREERHKNRARLAKAMTHGPLDDSSHRGLYLAGEYLKTPALAKMFDTEMSKVERLLQDSPASTDIAMVGMSVHAANFLTTIAGLRPDLHLAGIDAQSEIAKSWRNRAFLAQNQTNGPYSTTSSNLARSGGDLFPIGSFGSLRVPQLTAQRWSGGLEVSRGIRYNLGRVLDGLRLNSRLEGVEPQRDGLYRITMKNNDGQETHLTTQSVVLSGITKERRPFSSPRWQEEVSRSRRVVRSLEDRISPKDSPRVLTYSQFAQLTQTPEGERIILQDKDGGPKKVAVLGAGDGGNTVVSYLLGLGEDYQNSRQVLGFRPEIQWYGQEAKTGREFSRSSRSRYANICAGFDRSITPIDSKARNFDISATGRPRVNGEEIDLVVSCVGYEEVPLNNVLGFDVRTETLRDSKNRGLARKVRGQEIYVVGPSSGISPQDTDPEVQRLYRELGLPDNEVANFWRGPQTQRAAIELAKKFPLGMNSDVYRV